MSTLLNGVLAIIRNAPERAREYLREAKVKSVSDVYIAIVRAIQESNDKAKVECLRGILERSLRLTGEDEQYVQGITQVEKLIEEEIDRINKTQKAESQGTEDPGY